MNAFFDLSPQIATILLAMLPVTELRLSIPFALGVLHLPPWEAFFWSIIGDMVSAVIIIYTIGPISEWLCRHWSWADRMLKYIFAKTRGKFNNTYAKLGKIALIVFVAIPLPGTGAWTGSLAAWLFNIEKKESVVYIFLGVILSGILVTFISLGFFQLFNL